MENIKEEEELIFIDEIVPEDEFLDESINTTMSALEGRDLIADLNDFEELTADSLIGAIDLTNIEGDIEIYEEFEALPNMTCELCKLKFKTVSNLYRHFRSRKHKILETALYVDPVKSETIQQSPLYFGVYNDPGTDHQAILASPSQFKFDNDPGIDHQAIKASLFQYKFDNDPGIDQHNIPETPFQFKIENDPDKDQYKIVAEIIKREGVEVVAETIKGVKALDYIRSDLGCQQENHKNKIVYKCTYCMKKFSSSSNLRRHVNLHLPNNIFKCAYCPRTFKQREYWKKHSDIHRKYPKLAPTSRMI